MPRARKFHKDGKPGGVTISYRKPVKRKKHKTESSPEDSATFQAWLTDREKPHKAESLVY